MKKEDLLKFYQKYKLYLFPAVVALSSTFLILFAIIPQTMKLIENQKEMQELRDKTKSLETKVSVLESYDEQDLSQKTGYVLNAFPSEKDFGSILGFLQQITERSGFNIKEFTLSDRGSNKLSDVGSYMVRLQIRGAKVLFQTLLNNLESSSRLLKIESIEIGSNSSAQTTDASLVLLILYAPLPADFGAEDTPLPEITQADNAQLAKLVSTNTSIAVYQPTETVESSESASIRGKEDPFN